jgi:[acyl-carrier-protein] S-malonyltransferase
MSKTAFIFAGQGAQYSGMGKELEENIKACKDIFQKADSALGFPLSEICFSGTAEELRLTENAQPAILTMSIAAMEALVNRGIKPCAVAGLSLGEYSALVCSGVLDFETAVKLVKKRGKFMEEAVPKGKGAMAAILGLNEKEIIDICSKASQKGVIEPANFNCPGQIVIAGEISALEYASELAKEKGARKVIRLSVSGPFHTSLLKNASDRLYSELIKIELNQMKVPVLTNLSGDYIKPTDDIKEILRKQVMSSVRWEDIIRNMIKAGVDTFVEIGPGRALSSFVKKTDRSVKVLNVEDMSSLNKTVEWLTNKE